MHIHVSIDRPNNKMYTRTGWRNLLDKNLVLLEGASAHFTFILGSLAKDEGKSFS